MNKEQVKDLFKRIKGNYDKFSINGAKLDEWVNILKEYSNKGVNDLLDQYIKDGNPEAPMCVSLISEFNRIKTYKNMVDCKYCHKMFDENDLDNLYLHEDRCRSVEYIKTKEYLVNKTFNKYQLLNYSEDEFNKFYDIFLEQIKVLNNNGSFNLNTLYKSI